MKTTTTLLTLIVLAIACGPGSLTTDPGAREAEALRSKKTHDGGSPSDGGVACQPLPKAPLANPAAVYCEQLGYTLSSKTTEAGEQGFCNFPGGLQCDEWAFFDGACGQAFSFCNLHGGTISTETKDEGGWTSVSGVCTLSTGKRCSEVTFSRTCGCE